MRKRKHQHGVSVVVACFVGSAILNLLGTPAHAVPLAHAYLTVIFLAMGFYLMQECSFLIPYRMLLYEKYAQPIAVFAAVLFLNLFAAIYVVSRKLFLKDTGRKLAHVEKQLRTGQTISDELTSRLSE